MLTLVVEICTFLIVFLCSSLQTSSSWQVLLPQTWKSLFERISSWKINIYLKQQLSWVWTRWQCGGSRRRSWRLISFHQFNYIAKCVTARILIEWKDKNEKHSTSSSLLVTNNWLPAKSKGANPPRPTITFLNSFNFWIMSRSRTNKLKLKSFTPGNCQWEQQPCTVPPRRRSRQGRWSLLVRRPLCSNRSFHGPDDTTSPPFQNPPLFGSLSLAWDYIQPLPGQSCKMCFFFVSIQFCLNFGSEICPNKSTLH